MPAGNKNGAGLVGGAAAVAVAVVVVDVAGGAEDDAVSSRIDR